MKTTKIVAVSIVWMAFTSVSFADYSKKVVCRSGQRELVIEFDSTNEIYLSEGDYPNVSDWEGTISCTLISKTYDCKGTMVSAWGPWAGENRFLMDVGVIETGVGHITNQSMAYTYSCGKSSRK